MGSYFVDRHAQVHGGHLVHERSRCHPDYFPKPGRAEYLGEFLDGGQAIVVASLKYRGVNGCLWCATEVHRIETATEDA